MFGLSNSTLKKYFLDPAVPPEQLELEEKCMVWGVFIVGASCASFCLLWAVACLWPVYEQSRCEAWPATTGTIIAHQESDSTDAGNYYSVKYAYQVGGVSYNGDRVSYLSGSKSDIEPYPVGLQTTVHYDPAKPGQSVLRVDFSWGFLAFPLVGVVTAVSTFVFGCLGSRVATQYFSRRRAIMAID
jgi:hypothetical protein